MSEPVAPAIILPCTIVYCLNGRVRRWTVSAAWERDNDTTLRTHLVKWIPAAEFIKIRWRARPESEVTTEG